MVERLQDMPPGTLGFRATGQIAREDYADVLVPELHRALEGGGRLRTLYVIEDLDEIEPSALWTDIEWMAHATRMFGWMIPGQARVFPVAELERAKAWVAADGTG